MDVEVLAKSGITFEKSTPVVDKVAPVIEKVTKKIEDLVDKTIEKIEVVEKVVIEIKETGIDAIKKKVDDVSVGKLVTIIHGDIDSQKVINGKIISILEGGITVIDQNDKLKDPVIIAYDSIIDIFGIKRLKKEKEVFSMFKLKRSISEFFRGSEEEIQHAYEQKITEKKYKEELKKKK